MTIYKSGDFKLSFSPEMVHYLKEHQRDFMPEDTKAGMIQAYLDRYTGSAVCSKQLFKEALNHPFDEPKQWEIREVNEIMHQCVTGWKYFSNPRMFEGYGRQKGWEREAPATGADNGREKTPDEFVEVTEQMERPRQGGEYSLFAGLIKCGECGKSLTIRYTNDKHPRQIYSCKTYNAFGKQHCTQHRVEYDTLYSLVLNKIRECARAALMDGEAVAGKLTDTCEDELKARVTEGRKKLADEIRLAHDARQWVEAIQEYADIRSLDAAARHRAGFLHLFGYETMSAQGPAGGGSPRPDPWVGGFCQILPIWA